MIIRAATPDDAASIAFVEVESWRTAYTHLMPAAYLDGLSVADKAASWRANLEKHGAKGRKRVLVASDGARVVGFVRVGPQPDDSSLGLVYLLYLLPSHWRNGIGRRLMEAAEQELGRLGTTSAILWVLSENHGARLFYERLCWTATGEVSREHYGDIELEALCYAKSIGASA
jgi:ribosomal protein S18 acetylase RimI-like enzyme